jgi:hypothetical protein
MLETAALATMYTVSNSILLYVLVFQIWGTFVYLIVWLDGSQLALGHSWPIVPASSDSEDNFGEADRM